MEQSAANSGIPALDEVVQYWGEQWQEIWAAASVFSGTTDKAVLLDMTLKTFLERCFRGLQPNPQQIAMFFGVISREKTHTHEALIAAFSRLAPERIFWTRGRRTVAAGVALWWIAVAAWEFVRVHRDYYGHIQAIDLAVLAPALAAAAYAAYRWVMRR